MYTSAKETGPSVRTDGRTGDYFARIAPSSQKAALLICLWSGDRGLPVITYDPLLAAGAISPAAARTTTKEPMGNERERDVCEREKERACWKPRAA